MGQNISNLVNRTWNLFKGLLGNDFAGHVKLIYLLNNNNKKEWMD